MGTITVGRENSAATDLHYEDQGSGRAVVLPAGRPFDGRSSRPGTHAAEVDRELLAFLADPAAATGGAA